MKPRTVSQWVTDASGSFGNQDGERQSGGWLADRLCKDEWVRGQEEEGGNKLFPKAVEWRRRQKWDWEQVRQDMSKKDFGIVLVNDEKSFLVSGARRSSDREIEQRRGESGKRAAWRQTEGKQWFSWAGHMSCTEVTYSSRLSLRLSYSVHPAIHSLFHYPEWIWNNQSHFSGLWTDGSAYLKMSNSWDH